MLCYETVLYIFLYLFHAFGIISSSEAQLALIQTDYKPLKSNKNTVSLTIMLQI